LVPLAIARALNPHAAVVRTVISAEKEIGRGVALAASGEYSNPVTPARALGVKDGQEALPRPASFRASVQPLVLANRNAAGALVDATAANTTALAAARAANEPLILHSVQGTKTNVREPYPPVARAVLAAGAPFDALVVVDACQARCTNAELAAFLRDGACVLVTGSKFYQGPPFSGALLVPPCVARALRAALEAGGAATALPPLFGEYFGPADLPWPAWRSQLPPETCNYGSALRWLGALAEMEAYHATGTPATRAEATAQWARGAAALCGGAVQVFEANGSIVNVTVRDPGGARMGVADLKLLHQWLAADLRPALGSDCPGASTMVFVGQPVEVARDFGVVRIALGSPDVRALLNEGPAAVLATDKAVIEKMNLVAKHFDLLRAHFKEQQLAR
jgi:hypothetical protein